MSNLSLLFRRSSYSIARCLQLLPEAMPAIRLGAYGASAVARRHPGREGAGEVMSGIMLWETGV